jgi:hypothetical protein
MSNLVNTRITGTGTRVCEVNKKYSIGRAHRFSKRGSLSPRLQACQQKHRTLGHISYIGLDQKFKILNIKLLYQITCNLSRGKQLASVRREMKSRVV